jgi:hypothetical protein
MTDKLSLSELENIILKPRRQRIRRSTYTRVAEAMIEDATLDQPFRHRLVLDWWSRVVNPLQAQKYDAERLRYFRLAVKNHRNSLAHNSALRQGAKKGKPLRRLKPERLAYMQYQIRRMSDRGLNYAAAARAVAECDQAYERLALGLVTLPVLDPSREGWLRKIVSTAVSDKRWAALEEKLRSDSSAVLPGRLPEFIEFRLKMLTEPGAMIWPQINDYVSAMKQQGLIRKIREEYLNEISGL